MKQTGKHGLRRQHSTEELGQKVDLTDTLPTNARRHALRQSDLQHNRVVAGFFGGHRHLQPGRILRPLQFPLEPQQFHVPNLARRRQRLNHGLDVSQ